MNREFPTAQNPKDAASANSTRKVSFVAARRSMARRTPEIPVSDADAARDSARLAILAAVAGIPSGRVASYGQIAWIAGLPGRARLVGRVLGTSLEPDTPWHRVINAAGQLSLPKFSPQYRDQKRRLRAEGVVFQNDRISLRRYGWQAGGDSPLID